MRRIKGLLLALAFFAGPVATGLAHASVAHAPTPVAAVAQSDATTLPAPMSTDAMNTTVGAGFWSSLWDALVETVEFVVIAAALFYGAQLGYDLVT